jgi:AcrR family transcriptional regulator
MTTPPVKGTRRERQAADTRREILEAAQRLFAARGYAATSVADVAAEAGVAIQTIYSSVGSKRALVGSLADHLDERSGVSDTRAAMQAAADPREVIRLGVRLTRAFHEHAGDLLRALVSAAAIEPEMAAILEEGRRRHRAGTLATVKLIASRWGLRDGLTAARGGAIFATLTSIPTWQGLLDEHGWSFDEIEDWMVATLAGALLAEG